MTLDEYQKAATSTDQFPGRSQQDASSPSRSELVPLLGLTGEVGGLLSEYKKLLRDGPGHTQFRDQVKEELGDILWYVSNVATKYELNLTELAQANLAKIRDRWSARSGPRKLYDEDEPPQEQLPRSFEYTITTQSINGALKVIVLDRDGKTVGHPLTDNAVEDDGYRFHDVFHFAHAAILGWSPVYRALLGRKRKTRDKTKDEIEDGGRAIVIEEGIVATVFEYGERNKFFTQSKRVDSELLKTLKRLTAGREVSSASAHDWEQAILRGFDVWNKIRASNGGVVRGDLIQGTFEYVGPASAR